MTRGVVGVYYSVAPSVELYLSLYRDPGPSRPNLLRSIISTSNRTIRSPRETSGELAFLVASEIRVIRNLYSSSYSRYRRQFV